MVWPLDFELACRCAGLLPSEKLDSKLRQWLIDDLIARLKKKLEPDLDKVIEALTQLKAVKELCASGLTHADSFVRDLAVYNLGELRAKEAALYLIKLLTDNEPSIRSKSAEALGKLG